MLRQAHPFFEFGVVFLNPKDNFFLNIVYSVKGVIKWIEWHVIWYRVQSALHASVHPHCYILCVNPKLNVFLYSCKLLF